MRTETNNDYWSAWGLLIRYDLPKALSSRLLTLISADRRRAACCTHEELIQAFYDTDRGDGVVKVAIGAAYEVEVRHARAELPSKSLRGKPPYYSRWVWDGVLIILCPMEGAHAAQALKAERESAGQLDLFASKDGGK